MPEAHRSTWAEPTSSLQSPTGGSLVDKHLLLSPLNDERSVNPLSLSLSCFVIGSGIRTTIRSGHSSRLQSWERGMEREERNLGRECKPFKMRGWKVPGKESGDREERRRQAVEERRKQPDKRDHKVPLLQKACFLFFNCRPFVTV